MTKPSIKRTGNTRTTYSSEYRIMYPDGTTETIWSPVPSRAETDAEAEKVAWMKWIARNWDT